MIPQRLRDGKAPSEGFSRSGAACALSMVRPLPWQKNPATLRFAKDCGIRSDLPDERQPLLAMAERSQRRACPVDGRLKYARLDSNQRPSESELVTGTDVRSLNQRINAFVLQFAFAIQLAIDIVHVPGYSRVGLSAYRRMKKSTQVVNKSIDISQKAR